MPTEFAKFDYSDHFARHPELLKDEGITGRFKEIRKLYCAPNQTKKEKGDLWKQMLALLKLERLISAPPNQVKQIVKELASRMDRALEISRRELRVGMRVIYNQREMTITSV